MRYTWEFILNDGTSVFARFSDWEIEEMKKKYPEVKWGDCNLRSCSVCKISTR
jgi:hypothetical protein